MLFILREGEGREKGSERNINMWGKHRLVASHETPTRDLAHDPGMFPDWESNQRPLRLQDNAQPTEPH